MSQVYHLNINNRAFNAIYEERKKIEIRANKKGRIDYSKLQKDDYIIFKDLKTASNILCKVIRKNWYATVQSLLETEGTEYSLSSTNSIEEGIKSIESISDYKEVIERNGVYAIAIERLSELFVFDK
ncbi:MAG: hypothetical protein K1W19_01710 [Lachnospiraceae bacterium]